MARINWLADVLRAAGCAVREDDASWKTRGSSTFDPRGLIIHATAGGLLQSNDSAYGVLVNGREGLAGPIAQVMVERGTGRWRPVCSGRSNHAKTGWAGNCEGLGNTNLIGIEFHHANTGAEPWTEPMLANYARGAAAICRHMGWGVNRIALHKEHQPGEKSDTTFDGNAFRARVQAYLNGTPQEEDMSQRLEWLAHCLEFGLEKYPNIPEVPAELRGREVQVVRKLNTLLARPAGAVTVPAELMQALGHQVLTNVGPMVEQAVAAAVDARVEAALRRVLGGLDGATPPA